MADPMTTENEGRDVLYVCSECDGLGRTPESVDHVPECPASTGPVEYVPKQELTQAEETIVALRREAGTHGRDAAKMIEDAYKSGREEERAYREALDSSTGSR